MQSIRIASCITSNNGWAVFAHFFFLFKNIAQVAKIHIFIGSQFSDRPSDVKQQQMNQLSIAKSFSDVPLCFFALCPVRTNAIFRFLASFFFNCFFTFFLAATSGFVTACQRTKTMHVLRNYEYN